MVSFSISPDKTYDDYLAVPEGLRAELIDGKLTLLPRPLGRNVRATSMLNSLVGHPFCGSAARAPDKPGTWWILLRPECHLILDRRVVIPDIAGWRRSRMSAPPADSHKFTLVPDWVCEVLSPSTAGHDTIIKMPKYLEAGVEWVWIVDPVAHRIESYHAVEREWTLAGAIEGAGPVRLPPFDAVELDFALAWDEGASNP
jgi:Uma2 family endonuclease